MWMTKALDRVICACVLSALLAACGGSDPQPPVTFAYKLKTYEEEASYREIRPQWERRGAVAESIECGVLDWQDESKVPPFLSPDGYSPRLLYVRFAEADAERVRDLPWLAVVDDAWRETYVPPQPCDAVTEW